MGKKVWQPMRKKVLVTGGRGLVGTAIKDISSQYADLKFVFTDRRFHDLTRESDIERLFIEHKPDYIIQILEFIGVFHVCGY